MDTNLYWSLRGSFSDKRLNLAKARREWLEASIIDQQYNAFLRPLSDYEDGEGQATRLRNHDAAS